MSFPTDYPKSLQKLDMLVMIGVCNSKETESVKCSGNHVDLPPIVISSNSNYTKTGSAGRSACDIDIRTCEEGKKKSRTATMQRTPCVRQLASSCADLTPTGGRTGLLRVNYTLNVDNDC